MSCLQSEQQDITTAAASAIQVQTTIVYWTDIISQLLYRWYSCGHRYTAVATDILVHICDNLLSLQKVLRECLEPQVESLTKALQSAGVSDSHPVKRILRSLEAGLSYQYHAAWGLVLKTLAVYFSLLAKPSYPFIKKVCFVEPCCKLSSGNTWQKVSLLSVSGVHDRIERQFSLQLQRGAGLCCWAGCEEPGTSAISGGFTTGLSDSWVSLLHIDMVWPL